MLKNQWPDVPFNFASLSDRKPVSEEDDLVVLAAPDPQSKAILQNKPISCKTDHAAVIEPNFDHATAYALQYTACASLLMLSTPVNAQISICVLYLWFTCRNCAITCVMKQCSTRHSSMLIGLWVALLQVLKL